MTIRSLRHRARRTRGQALTEFAIVFPIAILMILAIFDAGRAVFIYNGLTNAAREGARLAIVNQDKAMVAQRVNETSFGSGISNLADLDDLVSYFRQNPNLDPTQNSVCTTMATGCIAVVTARTDWSAITPIIGSIIGPIDFVARSELPIELVCPNAKYAAYATAALCPKQP